MDEIYEEVGSAWKSNGFVAGTKFRDLVHVNGGTEKAKPFDRSWEHTEVNRTTTEGSE